MECQAAAIKILDGGLASELQRNGFAVENDPLWGVRWLAKEPSAIEAVHISYLESGADVISTCSYQASIQGFCEHLNVNINEAKELILSSVTVAKKAREIFWDKYKQDKSSSALQERCYPLVAGSIGPYGAYLHDGSEYSGNYVSSISIEELMDWHRPRMQCLVNGGVDILALETLPAAKEGIALLKLLREFPNIKAWISFGCKDELHTWNDDSFSGTVKMCLKYAPENQLAAVGVNCINPKLVTKLLQVALEEKAYLDLIVYPNSGEAWDPEKGWSGGSANAPLFTYVPEWLANGATWIGGCCRSTPEDINHIRATVIEQLQK